MKHKEMNYKENNSRWIKKQEEYNILSINDTSETRIASIKRLVSSNLPTYTHTFISLEEFIKEKKSTYIKYTKQEAVFRICPDDEKKYDRYTYIGKSYKHIKRLVEKNIKKDIRERYTVIINEYDPAKYCGVILSKQNELTIEMVQEPNLENLCHGHIIPWSATLEQRVIQGYKRMYYHNIIDNNIKQIMWNVIKCISEVKEENYFLIKPRLGYFEFTISKKTGQLKFIDYKIKT